MKSPALPISMMGFSIAYYMDQPERQFSCADHRYLNLKRHGIFPLDVAGIPSVNNLYLTEFPWIMCVFACAMCALVKKRRKLFNRINIFIANFHVACVISAKANGLKLFQAKRNETI